MKRLIVGILLVVTAGWLPAQNATVTYLEGDVDVRKQSGSVFPADFGDQLDVGDRVITHRAGSAELELTEGGVVNVAPDTVFIIGSETGAGGERTGRLSAAVGSFAFRFNVAVGREPRVGSTTSVAGVRGTELRVYAASDGTTRFEVLEGLVEIQDAGRRVTLGAEQGVEVAPGRGPSTVFAFLEQPIDYSVWNAGLVDDFLDDPLPALRGIASEMNDLMDEIERRGPRVDGLFEAAEAAEAELDEVEEENGKEAREQYFLNTVMPARRIARAAYVDFRFVVLSALSLDQYVLSRLAAEIEAKYYLDPDTPVLQEFGDLVDEVRDRYERVVVPRLVPSDL
jgi:hypothetical protein